MNCLLEIYKDFSNLVDTSVSTLQNYLRGVSTPNGEFLIKINSKIGISPSWLLLGEGSKFGNNIDCGEGMENPTSPIDDFVHVPRFDVAASAGGGAFAESEEGTGRYAFNRSWLDRRGLKTNHLAVIAVRGDSMEPELYDGDLILLDRSSTDPKDGDMFVVRYAEELFVKRIQYRPWPEMALLSSNRYYSPIPIDPRKSNDLAFIGKVVASMHEW